MIVIGVRRETIILELEDNASREALQAAAAFKTLDKSISGLSGAAVRSRAFQTISRDVDKMGTSFDRAGNSIDTFSGRLGLLTQAAFALGPAIVPIGASLVPAVSGLATGIAGAAGAAAAAGLAFAGVGDALGALNDVQLEPTAENFIALQEAMDKLGPAGTSFARFLNSIGGDLETLQRTAGANMFPGMQQGLESLVSMMPRADRLVAEFATRLGNLTADGGAALAGPEWESFFSFLETDAAPIFDEFARAAGNVALGLGNLMVAFAPLSRDFASGMLEASQSFAAWSADSSNFTEFIDYVRQIGPQVSDFLGSLADAAVALTTAVAPWGSVVLPAMTTLLDLFTAVAGSPIGPALTTAALAMLAFNKAAAASSMIMGRVTPAVGGVRQSFSQMRTDLSTVATTWATAGAATERESKKMAAATGRLKGNLATVGKGAAVVGAVGVAASGAAEGIGLQNTAMLGLAGTMAGPWGAAAGAAVGLILDFKAAQEQAAASAKDLAATLDSQTGAVTNASASLVTSKLTSDQVEKLNELGLNVGEVSRALAGGTKSWDAYYDSLTTNQKAMLRTRESFLDFTPFINELDNLAKQGDDASTAWEAQGDAIEFTAAAASAAVASFNELTAAQRAQTQAALAGIDAGTRYGAALDAAMDQADKGTEGLNKFTEAGRANRTALSQLVGSYNAQDQATRDSVKGYNEARRAIAEIGHEMGLSAAQIREFQGYLEKPAALKVNTKEAQAAIRGAKTAFESLPGEVQSHITTKGVPKTNAEIDALVAKYKLTEEQRTALVTLKDAASAGIGNIIRLIHNVKGKTVTVGVNTGNAVSNVAAVQHAINALSGKTVTVTTMQKTIYMAGKQSAIAEGRADGGEVLGQRYPYGDKVLVALAPGEEVISNRYGQADAFRRDRAAGVIPAYADGGTIGIPGYATGGTVRGAGIGTKSLERSLGRLEKAVDRNRERLDHWNSKRSELRSDVVGSQTLDWFNSDKGVWSGSAIGGTAAFAQQQWKQQAKNSNALKATVANLKKNGASDAFIAEILRSEDPLAAAQMFNKQSKSGMRHSQSLFLSATRATASAASYTSGVVYGDEQAKATRELRGLRGDVRDVKKAINRNHKQAEGTRNKQGAGKAVSSGSRARTRSKRG